MANNNSSNLAGFGNFAGESFAGTAFNTAQPFKEITRQDMEKGGLFYGLKEMTRTEETMFRREVEQIRQLAEELKVLAKQIKAAENSKAPAKKAFEALGVLPLGNTSFRGRNGPQIYLAPTKNGEDVEVRVNFSVDGRPFRVSHPDSFNAALAAMRQKRTSAKTVLNTYSRSINQSKSVKGQLSAEYNRGQIELAKLVNQLIKAQQEYRARNKPVGTVQPSSTPSVFTSNTSENERQFQASAAPVPAPRRSFLSRLNPFAKRTGGTRRTKNRKTRKNRKNSRR